MITGRIEHGCLLQVTECAKSVVRCGASDKDTDSLADKLLFGNSGILKGLIGTLEK